MSDVWSTLTPSAFDVLVLFAADDTVDAISVVLIALPIVLSEMSKLKRNFNYVLFNGLNFYAINQIDGSFQFLHVL